MTTERALELQENISKEAIALMVIHGASVDVQQYKTSIALIGKAWSIPAAETEKRLSLIDKERAEVDSADNCHTAIHVLPESELPMNATGMETLDNIWGLFETSLVLSDESERVTLFELARELEECQNLLDWINLSSSERMEIAAALN